MGCPLTLTRTSLMVSAALPHLLWLHGALLEAASTCEAVTMTHESVCLEVMQLLTFGIGCDF